MAADQSSAVIRCHVAARGAAAKAATNPGRACRRTVSCGSWSGHLRIGHGRRKALSGVLIRDASVEIDLSGVCRDLSSGPAHVDLDGRVGQRRGLFCHMARVAEGTAASNSSSTCRSVRPPSAVIDRIWRLRSRVSRSRRSSSAPCSRSTNATIGRLAARSVIRVGCAVGAVAVVLLAVLLHAEGGEVGVPWLGVGLALVGLGTTLILPSHLGGTLFAVRRVQAGPPRGCSTPRSSSRGRLGSLPSARSSSPCWVTGPTARTTPGRRGRPLDRPRRRRRRAQRAPATPARPRQAR